MRQIHSDRIFLGFVGSILILFFFIGCDKPTEDGTKDRARQEQEAAQDVERKALAERSKRMEAELRSIHQYYASLEGQFLGTFALDGRQFQIVLTFVRNLPVFDGGRTRELSEIESERSALKLRVKSVQLLSGDPLTSVTCVSQEVVAQSFTSGTLQFDVACPAGTNSYRIYFSDPERAQENSLELAQALAGLVNSGALFKVPRLVGQIYFGTNPAAPVSFSALRKEDTP